MNPDHRLYTPTGVALGTLLGTLAGGAALLWLNYRMLGYPRLANRMAAAGLLGYLLIVTVASLLPNEAWLAVVFLLLQTGIAYQAAERLQGEAVRYYLAQGATPQPLISAGAVGLLAGLTVVLLLVMLTRLTGLSALHPGGS